MPLEGGDRVVPGAFGLASVSMEMRDLTIARQGLHLAPLANSPFPQVLELMLSDSGTQLARHVARTNLVAILLFLADWAQLFAILVSKDAGWTFE